MLLFRGFHDDFKNYFLNKIFVNFFQQKISLTSLAMFTQSKFKFKQFLKVSYYYFSIIIFAFRIYFEMALLFLKMHKYQIFMILNILNNKFCRILNYNMHDINTVPQWLSSTFHYEHKSERQYIQKHRGRQMMLGLMFSAGQRNKSWSKCDCSIVK